MTTISFNCFLEDFPVTDNKEKTKLDKRLCTEKRSGEIGKIDFGLPGLALTTI